MSSIFVNAETNNIFSEGEQMNTRRAFLNTLIRLANATNPIDEFYNNGSIAAEIVSEFEKNGNNTYNN